MLSRHLAPLVAVLVGFALAAGADARQISSPGGPLSTLVPLPGAIPTVKLPAPDLAEFELDVQRAERVGLRRYGVVIPVALDPSRDGRWDPAPSLGCDVWRLRIASPGARSLGVLFGRFDLPPGARLHILGRDGTTALGAFTEANEKPNGMLAIQPLAGDELVVECSVPSGAGSGAPVLDLAIAEVVHDVTGVLEPSANAVGKDGNCLIDINCPAGARHQRIKRASFMVLANGASCSAVLLNNTAEDAAPYFLTANHCGNLSYGVFVFGFERPECGGTTPAITHTISGATRLARSSYNAIGSPTGTDSALYRMSIAVPLAYEPLFAGWDRTAGTPSGPSYMIGFGDGDPKQIAVDADGVEPYMFTGGAQRLAAQWTEGQSRQGSSGSPLLTDDLRVAGQVCCVNTFVCGVGTTYFGPLSEFWAQEPIDQWLDPLASGVVTLEFYDPLAVGDAHCTSGASGAQIHALGSTSVTANELELRATEMPSGQFGLFFYGSGTAQVPLGAGTLCVGSPQFRLRPTLQAMANGAFSRVVDLSAPPDPSGQVMAGATWSFQAWFRITGGFDLSDAVAITFVP